MNLDADTLRRLWARAPQALVDGIALRAAEVFAKYGINTPLRAAHLMAQISHESGAGAVPGLRENLNYPSAARIAAVWPRRFTAASAAPYVRNPRKLADKVYNGRMGDRLGSDDGYNCRGGGLMQLTGLDSYKAMQQVTGLPLVTRPELVASPTYALEIAAAEFKKLGCLPYCDADNIEAVTRRVNGGYTGLASRKLWLEHWKAEFGHEDAVAPDVAPHEIPLVDIPRGSDEVLPAHVDNPVPLGLLKDPTTIAVGAGTVTTVASSLGGAVDSLKPFFANPHVLLAAAAVAICVCVFILWQRQQHIRSDNA